MPQFIYDEFSKQILEEVLKDSGLVETSKKIFSEGQEIDVLFTPHPESKPDLNLLGLLGKIASQTAVIEPFRNAVTPSQIRSCIGKLCSMYNERERQSKRNDSKKRNIDSPLLWILTPKKN